MRMLSQVIIRYVSIAAFALLIFPTDNDEILLIPQQDLPEPIILQSTWLWDPYSLDIEDWQILGRQPADLIKGEEGELFIADSDNARVIHITVSGELIDIIGRRGDGPGEFQHPNDLAYDSVRGILWVGERQGRSAITRFKRTIEGFNYIDRFIAPSFVAHFPSLILDVNPNRYWTNAWFQGKPDSEKTRIQLFDVDGDVLRSFGPIWEPKEGPWGGRYGFVNVGDIEWIGGDQIAFVWNMRPVVEVWRTEGVLIISQVFDIPELRRPKPYRRSPNVVRLYSYLESCYYLKETDTLYILFIPEGENRRDFFGLDPESLAVKEWLQLPLSEEYDEQVVFYRFVAVHTNGSVLFYGLDLRHSCVVVIEPVKHN